MPPAIATLLAGLTSLALIGCESGSPAPPPAPPPALVAPGSPSGDLQIAAPNATLPAPLRVVITQGGAPVVGRLVDWAVENGGTVNPASSATGADGAATTVVTLGSRPIMTITASSANTAGGPVQFRGLAITNEATVQVLNNRFDPQTTPVKAGGTVTFTWGTGASQHDLIPDDGADRPSEATVRDSPFSISVTFPTPGEYFYHCGVHGGTRSGMFGKVVVFP